MMKNYEISIGYDLEKYNILNLMEPIKIDFGLTENSHCLLTGMSGSGKSYLELELIAKLIKNIPDSEIYFGDYKGDDSFRFLRSSDRYYFYDKTTDALEEVYQRLLLRISGEEAVTNQVNFIWDEYVANILSIQNKDSKLAKKMMNQIGEILMVGRSKGIRLICTCQRPEAAVFPAGSRNNYGVIVILGAPMKSTYEMLLPSKEYIDPLLNQKFSKGEGVLLLNRKGVEQRLIKVPTVRNIDNMKQLCLSGLQNSELKNSI